MSEIDKLIANFQQFVAMPWEQSIAGPQKVWFAIYDPEQERRLRLHVPEFQLATEAAGHGWHLVDLTNTFAEWMGNHRYQEAYFESPEDLSLALNSFTEHVVQELRDALSDPSHDNNTIVAVLGVGSLFGLTRVSTVIEKAASAIQGRLLLFFPGHYENGNYRLLDARDGWNYLAVPITA